MPRSAFHARCAELGQARLDRIARHMVNGPDNTDPWPDPPRFPFVWSEYWAGTVELDVADHAAEVGFWIDLLGFTMTAFWDDAVMLRSPDKSFGLALYPAGNDRQPVQGMRIEFMLDNLVPAVEALKERGAIDDIVLNAQWGESNPMRSCVLYSPSGIKVSLWGQVSAGGDEDSTMDETPAEIGAG